MGKKFDLIVFDWDGTLMDSTDLITRSLQAAASDLDLPEPSPEAARHVIGLALDEALRQLFPEQGAAAIVALADRYRYHYLKAADDGMPLFAGAEEMVKGLNRAGYFLAVATGKGRGGLDRAMAQSRLADYFHASRCADECFSKPHPMMLLQLIEEFGVLPERTLMIGDTSHDLLMAANAKVPALGVSYGAHPKRNLQACSPLACVDDVAGLRIWLETNA